MRTITAVSLWHIDITWSHPLKYLSQPLMQPIPIVSPFTLLFSGLNSCSIGFEAGDWLGHYHFFAFIKSLTELAGCFGSLSWCNMKNFPMNLEACSWILVGKMILYPSKFILLLSSYMKSSVKLRGPVPETACMSMPWHHLHQALQMRIHAWDLLQFLFSSTFLLSHHIDKGSSLSHRPINTLILPFYVWCWSEVCILLCTSVILCQSLLRTVDCQSITAAFCKLLVILQTRLLGFIFIAFLIRLSSTTVVFSVNQVIAGVAGCFQTLDFSMPFVLAIALIDFLFSFSIWIACFSLKVSSFILVGVCHHQMQNQL